MNPPYQTVLKPYGEALVDLARGREDVVCLGADLTRQTETDLFRDRYPDRFFNAGMAEANLIGIASGLARAGLNPFVHTFGVFCTRRAYDQVAMTLAYPKLSVKLIGFMPGLTSPGGPSHQAIDDMALMRALPNMTVVDVADAVETRQVVTAIADHDGPVYVRLKRGEIPVVFDGRYAFGLERATILAPGNDLVLVASGIMLPTALKAAEVLRAAALDVGVVHCPVVKPLDRDCVLKATEQAKAVITVENHSIIGGLGSAVAEVLAEDGRGHRLRRVGIQDRFATPGTRPYLFRNFGLDAHSIVTAAWALLKRQEPSPPVRQVDQEETGVFEPV
ncbi:MAG: transketolase family protein [Egibacteraceae bacterium]